MNIKAFKVQRDELVKRIDGSYDRLKNNEEITKTSLIMPFFSAIGYDVFNPQEFIPEYTADYGTKKGEKVDYAIKDKDELLMIVECKALGEKLNNHSSQLFRYFSVEDVKIAILTNGLEYRFFSDIEKENIMDDKPFFTINIKTIKDSEIEYLKQFSKEVFSPEKILNKADDIKYTEGVVNRLNKELENPSRDFIKLMMDNLYEGKKTQSQISEFGEIVKKALTIFKGNGKSIVIDKEMEKSLVGKLDGSKKLESREEKESYILGEIRKILNSEDVNLKVNKNDSAIIIKNFVRKNVCRLRISKDENIVLIPNKDGVLIKNTIKSLAEIKNLSNDLKASFEKYKD